MLILLIVISHIQIQHEYHEHGQLFVINFVQGTTNTTIFFLTHAYHTASDTAANLIIYSSILPPTSQDDYIKSQQLSKPYQLNHDSIPPY